MSTYTTEGAQPLRQQDTYTAGMHTGKLTVRYQGIRADIDALQITLGLPASGLNYSITPLSGPMAELSYDIPIGPGGIDTPTNTPLTTEWAFNTPCALVPKAEHPSFTAAYANLTARNAASSMEYDQIWKGDKVWKDRSSTLISDMAALSIADQTTLTMAYQDKIHDAHSYYRAEPTLTVVDRYQGAAPYGINTASVNVVYTTSQLITALTYPNRPYNPMPVDIQGRIRSGEWLCESVEANASSSGARINTQTFRWAPKWDSQWYTHAT